MEENKHYKFGFEKDSQLIHFVELVDKIPISMPLMILSHGFLISGQLVSSRVYVEHLIKMLDKMSDNTTEDKGWSEKIRSTAEEVLKAKQAMSSSYLHLEDAKFFHPDRKGIPENNEVVWRGRISEVSGFFFGKLKSEK